MPPWVLIQENEKFVWILKSKLLRKICDSKCVSENGESEEMMNISEVKFIRSMES